MGNVENQECLFKLKENYILRKIADSYMIVPIGDQIANFGGVIEASASVAVIWDMLKAGATKGMLVTKLTEVYEVSIEEASEDIDTLIRIMLKRKMFE